MSVALSWGEAHCVVPDGFRRGEPFRLYDFQSLYLQHFYLVRPTAEWLPDNPVKAPAFVYRRGMLVGPQKLGKSPHTAFHTCIEGAGPALFAGWAGKDEGYVCRDHGCHCGWEYPYDPGEPKGMHWPTPLIQITAFSEEQTDNIYDSLRPMIELGRLADVIPKTGEQFIRLPGGGRIDTVTSSAQSRLGQRVTFVPQDEVGIWTHQNKMDRVADTQYRGLSGMGGRASLTSNAWDPAQQSVAQQQYESASTDVYRQFVQPPKSLSYGNKVDRRKIHRLVYPTDTVAPKGHVDLDAIEAEAADLAARDQAQAARFYGNILTAGAGRVWQVEEWEVLAQAGYTVAPKALITLGFDGSKSGDHTALVATEITSGYQWPLGIWDPTEYGGEIPRHLVDAAVDAAMATYTVWRMYADPPYWRDELATWKGRYGDKVVADFETYRPRPMAMAIRNFATAMTDKAISHSGDPVLAQHVANCYRRPVPARDDKGEPLWVVQKERPESPDKIDAAMAAILSWEARTDAVAAGANAPVPAVAFY